MSPTTVSVVIPVRDDATELAVCLALLARQSHPLHEVVVVDNGSSDGSAAVARAAGARVVPESRIGIPHAAATGYDAATGDLIARLDADSRPSPDWVARIVEAMADPATDAVTGPGRFHDLPPVIRQLAGLLYLGSYYALTWLALANIPLWGSSMAVRRSVWSRVSHLVHRDADVHDDMDLAFVLGPRATIRYVRALRVGVSGRSVRGSRQLRRRMDRAFTTLRLNWEVQPPWERWQARITRRL
ncbi:glycosyltransferase family 2 protein [Nocardioides gilvus]|uniref:glycosyltransferase family 2 protein n=1 Tax=Nocardioides gilvus TaxID=1735589 RepID=UPI000D7464F7|nr:glycosyltransferase family 2 protein [Nocardioides gilvus]